MNFLFPIGFAFLALIPVVTALYLLKVRRRPVAVPSLLLWQQVLAQKKRRSLFQKLRQWLSLLLHLLILTLIILALTRPVPAGRAAGEGAATVLVIDDRARMQAVDAGGRRFDQVVTAALPAALEANLGQEVAILTTAGQPQVVQPFSQDRLEVRDALERLSPKDAGGDLEAAIRLASELVSGREGGGRVVVFSDQPAPENWDENNWRRIGAAGLDNLAITEFAARSTPNSPGTAEVLVEIANFSDESRSGNLELQLENRLLEVRPFDLAPGETTRLIFPALDARRKYANSRGWLTASLDTEDGLATDDTAYAVLPKVQPIRVLLTGQNNLFLERALRSEPNIQLDLLADPSIDVAREFDVVIFAGETPADWPWLEADMPSTLVLGAVPPMLADQDERIEQPLITSQDRTHPISWLIDFERLAVAESIAMNLENTPGWSWSLVVDAARTPLLVAGERIASGERLVVAGFDPIKTDLPLRVAFPLLISNSVRWLAGREQPLETFTATAGQPVRLATGESVLPEAVQEFRPVLESSRETWQTGTFIPMDTGFYQTRQEGETGWLAVSLADPELSDLRQPMAAESESAAAAVGVDPVVKPNWDGWLLQSPLPLWSWLALVAALLFTAEWWWFHRRRTE